MVKNEGTTMTFKGDRIIGKPTFAMIESFIAEKGLFCEPQDVLTYWENKKWLTNNGAEPKTLEIAIHVFNSIATQKEVRNRIKNAKFKNKKEKEQRKKEIYDSLKKVKKLKSSPLPTPYMHYVGQLSDARWKAFREFVFVVRGEKCETCGNTTNLQVHHLQYRNYAMAWEYNCNEVVVLCRNCHKKIHGIE